MTPATTSPGVRERYADLRSPEAQGPDVGTVVRRRGRPLRLDHDAVADHLVVGHLLDDETFDRDVRLSVSPLSELAPLAARSTPERALQALRARVRGAIGTDCTLSLSGGLDSRLLLAVLLAEGVRPHVLVSGVPESFDMEVGARIARTLGLPTVTVTVSAGDVRHTYPGVVAATSGTLPMTHWAGVAHVAVAMPGLPDPLVVGHLGELARGYYLPAACVPALRESRRPPAGAVDRLAAQAALVLGESDRRRCAPELADALRPEAVRARLAAAVPASAPNRRAALDHFFHRQYGKRKVGATLAAVGVHTPVLAPFADPAVAAALLGLPLRRRVGDRWHRWALAQLRPDLLEFPEEGYGDTTARRPPVRSWLLGPRPPDRPFFVDQSMFSTAAAAALLADCAGDLHDLVDLGWLTRLATERPPRPQLIYALASLALWRRTLTPDHPVPR